ncbi:Fis family transcriptional regulator [Brevibacillus reuszeri]|uniref:Fis family transcriptional regulator n=1 Tax=Brevibacillus reuszeri TaxID=54915 RepID=A0A0K9YL94_9BACL|nr:sigma 54-interacting transcriptional regulator [Brevibacillus reuszeri]KNB69426.1 Fis family transcriptional regulator [Brevibacillus reuszeri]MED1860254.1 sigma 54-interacting transcriptional regulator [Brevibacillus reuszeri]GED70857.1 Fis family transcriptional regulator [Brevibacillus reuszeri]
MNEFVLLAGSKDTRTALINQLQEIMDGYVQISSYSIEEELPKSLHNQLVVLSHPLVLEEPKVRACIGTDCKVIIAKRIINYENIDKLLYLPAGTRALYVNDSFETCMESIESLKKLGIEHIHYIPFYPGLQNARKIEIAVTPGAFELIPEHVHDVVNIGPRLMDISTIHQILDHFQLHEPEDVISQRYLRKIIQLSKRLADANQIATNLNKHLNEVLDGVNDGILTITQGGKITVFNEELGHLLGVSPNRVIGQSLGDAIDHPELIEFLLDSSDEKDRWFTFGQVEAVVHRFPLNNDQSLVATFKNARKTIELERSLRSELKKKGFVAKYTFDDIIGESSPLTKTKAIAKKLAKTDLTLLIQGESGTGKELFASAIHNASLRDKRPFLAVNFSAISEDLMESELFGYDDGAFTGAKKGGKVGLFEQANGGTIFLDEIGDSSLKLQARLLRVLQEKEIMRIGGSKIIPIDVRIIAATNKNLLHMIEQGTFREDLYHRLRVLFVDLPSLRNRTDDIPLLVRHFIHQSKHPHVAVMPQVIEKLASLPWHGNVRELKNTIDYMLAVCEESTIHVENIPLQSTNPISNSSPDVQERTSGAMPKAPVIPDEEDELLLILRSIQTIAKRGETPNRRRIMEMSAEWTRPLSEQQIRSRLDVLELRGYIVKNRGRFGTRLTEAGVRMLE